MSRPLQLTSWKQELATRFPELPNPVVVVLALYSFGMILGQASGLSTVTLFLVKHLGLSYFALRKRLSEFYKEAPAKSGVKQGIKRQDFDVATCFSPLLRWILSLWSGRQLPLAIDVTNLGERFHVLCISVVVCGVAIPIAWKVLLGGVKDPWNPHWEKLLKTLKNAVPVDWTVLVLSDRGLESSALFRVIVGLDWHPLMRVKKAGRFRPKGWSNFYHFHQLVHQVGASFYSEGVAYTGEPLRCTLLACWTAGHEEPWLVLTDLPPEAGNAVWYGLRTWIEQGFKVIKSGGWDWHKTRMDDPMRVERLWLVLAVATLWIVALGAADEAQQRLQEEMQKLEKELNAAEHQRQSRQQAEHYRLEKQREALAARKAREQKRREAKQQAAAGTPEGQKLYSRRKVIVEPVFGQIKGATRLPTVLETHSPTRNGQTWTIELQQATADLNVEIGLVCSDRAKGLLACAEHGLNVPHSPDLMHTQRDIQQPMLLPLRRQVEKATAEVQVSQSSVEQWQQSKQVYQTGPRSAGRPPEFDEHIRRAEHRLQQTKQEQHRCEERLGQAREAIRELADEAHPFDAKTGAPLEAKEVGELVDECLNRLEKIVDAAGLGEKASVAVAKGHGWTTTLMSLVTWFWALARRRVQAMNLPEAVEQAVYQELLPAVYWQQKVRRGRDARQKRQRKELAERLEKHAWRQGGVLAALPEETRGERLRQAKELAGLFVRSSSCVEGRNGRLSLLQHGHVRLSKQTLAAQKVIHNYRVKREDGTTAAERFFGKKPEDLFEAMLLRMPNLPRPAAKRPRKGPEVPTQAG